MEQPQTKEDFLKIKETVLELLDNPYADSGMKERLKVKLEKVEQHIKTL